MVGPARLERRAGPARAIHTGAQGSDSGPEDREPPEHFTERKPDPPLVRLVCHPVAPPSGSRMANSFGFGVTPAPIPRKMMIRIGTLGTMLAPAQSMHSGMPPSGDAEIGWLPPLDPDAPVRRATLPLSRLSGTAGRIYEAWIGHVIDGAGTLVYRGAVDNSPDGEGESPTGGKLIRYVEEALAALGAGKPVAVAETEAYGCSVKYAQ